MSESPSAYQTKKRFYDSVLTVIGRKPVLEALQNRQLTLHRLHLADSNRRAGIVAEICALAEARGIEIVWHTRQALSHLSKNRKQDQGVALDIQTPGFQDYKSWLESHSLGQQDFIALDGITNPQNLGMIVRTVCASAIAALILPRKGCARLDALVIKASAGTLFKSHILWCDRLEECLAELQSLGAHIACLDAQANCRLKDHQVAQSTVYVLGNETRGPQPAIRDISDSTLCIPMHNSVESLNVAVTAGLIAFNRG